MSHAHECGERQEMAPVEPAVSPPGVLIPLSDSDKTLLLRLARRSLEAFLGNEPAPKIETNSPGLLQERAAFVTLWRRDTGELRGCRGECIAQRPLVQSVMMMAIAAAVNDPRFAPVEYEELPALRLEINALTPPQPIEPSEVMVGKHGLIIMLGRQLGLLLPEVPVRFGWNRRQYLEALCQKAGLPGSAWTLPDAHLLSFESEAWSEEE